MENNAAGVLLDDIGAILAQDREFPLENTFLYAELASQMVNPSIFKDLGDTLLYRWPTNDLCDALLELWDLGPEQHWSAMQYTISSGKFEAIFTYSDKFDLTATSLERCERVLH